MKSIASVLLFAALCAGCGSDPGWKRQTFAFSVPADPPAAAAETNFVSMRRVSVSPLFQSRSFTYRTGENAYEQDPYAAFLVSPDRALAEPLRAGLSPFGRVLEPGSSLAPSLVAEATVVELYCDFRHPEQPVARLRVRLVVFEPKADGPSRVVFDRFCSSQTPLTGKNPAALMSAWDAGLRDIARQISAEYVKASSPDGGR